MVDHTLTLRRDDDRLGQHYGQHYYVEKLDGVTSKIEYMGRETGLKVYDRYDAYRWAAAAAKAYGARFIDDRPDRCLYGWSSD